MFQNQVYFTHYFLLLFNLFPGICALFRRCSRHKLRSYVKRFDWSKLRRTTWTRCSSGCTRRWCAGTWEVKKPSFRNTAIIFIVFTVIVHIILNVWTGIRWLLFCHAQCSTMYNDDRTIQFHQQIEVLLYVFIRFWIYYTHYITVIRYNVSVILIISLTKSGQKVLFFWHNGHNSHNLHKMYLFKPATESRVSCLILAKFPVRVPLITYHWTMP